MYRIKTKYIFCKKLILIDLFSKEYILIIATQKLLKYY